MRHRRTIDKFTLEFFMTSRSLNDLLNILQNICENIGLENLNPRLKHFRYFQFTFFGLMLRINSLLEQMIFRLDVLKDNEDFREIYPKILSFKGRIIECDSLVRGKKMKRAAEDISLAATEYSKIFSDIEKILDKYEN